MATVTTGNATPLDITIPGNAGHFDLRYTMRSGIKYVSDLFLMAGKGGKYDGNLSPGTKQITVQSQAVRMSDVRWHEFDPTQTRTTLINEAGGYNTTATTLTVDSSAPFTIGDILAILETGEVIRVNQIPSATSIVVTRGVGAEMANSSLYPTGLDSLTSAASAITDNDTVFFISSAVEIGSLNRDSKLNEATLREAGTQIIRRDLSIPRTRKVQEGADLIDDHKFMSRREQTLLECMKDIEYTGALGKFSRKALSGTHTNLSSDGKIVTTSDSYRNVIAKLSSGTNRIAATALPGAGNGITVDKLDEIVFNTSSRPGSEDSNVYICGNEFKRAVQKLGANTGGTGMLSLQVAPGQETLIGAKVSGFVGSFGKAIFNYNKLYDQPGLKSQVNVLNTDAFQLVHLVDSELRWYDKSQDPSYDGTAGYMLGELGFVIGHPKEHWEYTSFTSLGV